MEEGSGEGRLVPGLRNTPKLPRGRLEAQGGSQRPPAAPGEGKASGPCSCGLISSVTEIHFLQASLSPTLKQLFFSHFHISEFEVFL